MRTLKKRFGILFAISSSLALAGSISGCGGGGGGGGGGDPAPSTDPQLISNLPTGQEIGTTILLSVSPPQAEHDYRLRISKVDEPSKVVFDYSDRSSWEWVPLDDATYNIDVTLRNTGTGAETSLVKQFRVDSRVTDTPVVTSTDHPLVALYSAPPCLSGRKMRVYFATVATPRREYTTGYKSCDSVRSMNFYIGGMLAGLNYVVIHEVRDELDQLISSGPPLNHKAGTVSVVLPATTVSAPPSLVLSLIESLVLISPLNFIDDSRPQIPFATDLSGKVVWYYDRTVENQPELFRPVKGGTFLMVERLDGIGGQTLQEIDIAGHIVRRTTAKRLSEQVQEMGYAPITSVHHEAMRLPDGRTAVLASVERILNDVQGATGPVDILGDYVLVLDENWQVVWVWDSFAHLDINRAAILGEVCGNVPPASNGCPPVTLVDGVNVLANDWTHSNSIGYSPADGDLIVSMRHQDWVLKINYDDGLGDGSVEWRFGVDGDFTIASSDPYPWPSHQHDAKYVSGDELVIFDNGNSRCQGDPSCNSRGQVFKLDEQNMTATPELNADLGVYAFAVGSAQKLLSGDYHFNAGIISDAMGPLQLSIAQEVRPSGSLDFTMSTAMPAYRSFRLINLYRGTEDSAPPL